MRIYLDNCCLNRPFDDQGQARIRVEAEAKLLIQMKIREGAMELAWSYILDYENEANPFEARRMTIAAWRQYAAVNIGESPSVIKQAANFVGGGLKAKDALHLACAIAAGCDFFVSTDDVILRRAKDVKAIMIVDPPSLIREMAL